jgi:hypothetical protein
VFKRCLTALLGAPKYERLSTELRSQCDVEVTAPKLIERQDKIFDWLRKRGPFDLPGDLKITVGERVFAPTSGPHAVASRCPRVQYCFDAPGKKKNDDPWEGLIQWGPFSRETLALREPRIVIFTPTSCALRVEQLVRSFRDGVTSTQRGVYSAGFATRFHLSRAHFHTETIDLQGVSPEDIGRQYQASVRAKLQR